MDNKIKRLIELVQKLAESKLDEAIAYMQEKVEEDNEEKPLPNCLRCKSPARRNGHSPSGLQRYICPACGKSFSERTNTAMKHSPYGEAIWKQAIRDTIEGVSLEKTAHSLSMAHSSAFNMRHKILMSMEAAEKRAATVIDGVCELDDTYVLENFKGSKLPDGYWRQARSHGGKAQKSGISNEYLSISTGVERQGKSYARTVTRATPGKEDVIAAFDGHIGKNALILCDGAASYNALASHYACTVINVPKDGKGFSNIDTANNFHSFIKLRYQKYGGLATKYLNRYNALFSLCFRGEADLPDVIYNMLMTNDPSAHRSVCDVKSADILII
jgi:transposase-like protein